MTNDAPISAVASPCTNVCRIDAASGRCAGCRRSLDEIADWSRMSEAQKLAVWAQLPGRGGCCAAPPPPPSSPATRGG